MPEGSLLIREVTREDAGEYTCTVENKYGQDTVNHQLKVQGLIWNLKKKKVISIKLILIWSVGIAPPFPPEVSLTGTTTNSIIIKLKLKKEEETPIHGFTVHYKPEYGEWKTVNIANSLLDYTIEELSCGTRYQLYVKAFNG